ncbi:hypothetical protein SKAU_G00412330 [Synaphobranchus kaupii]|uniref:Uncharacterized protein n=1 Tax=Synaphobranchus kaupii TaxID=118154 RepID=A0A9Q1IBU2_SYNKA|nr:hypothetical protein SKAU_G00412330 [Synaphobranchus kaupii]
MIDTVGRWMASYRKEDNKRALEKGDRDMSKQITPEMVKTFKESKATQEAVTVLHSLKAQVSQTECVLVRDMIMISVLLTNANRSGVLANMLLDQVQNIHETHPAMKSQLSDLMCHRVETASKSYRTQQLWGYLPMPHSCRVLRHQIQRKSLSKTDDLENRGRRKNIRMFGLKEGAEGSRPLLDFVHDKLPQWLGLGSDKSFTLERVHRTLAPANPNHNRAVLIRFLKFQDKELVLRSTKQRDITHDGSKLSFAQDLSAETIRQRREFNGAKKLFLDMGTFRGFHLHPCKLRVLYNGKIQLFASPANSWRRNSTEESVLAKSHMVRFELFVLYKKG